MVFHDDAAKKINMVPSFCLALKRDFQAFEGSSFKMIWKKIYICIFFFSGEADVFQIVLTAFEICLLFSFFFKFILVLLLGENCMYVCYSTALLKNYLVT